MHRTDTFYGGRGGRCGGYSRNYQRPPFQSNSQPVRPLISDRHPNFRGNVCRAPPITHPQLFPYRSRPNFVVELHSDRGFFSRPEVEALITKCKSRPVHSPVFNLNNSRVRLDFAELNCALEAVVSFWESRFDVDHHLTPKLTSHVKVDSDGDELSERLKLLFIKRICGLMDGKLMDKWQKKLQNVMDEIDRVSGLLRRRNNPIRVFEELFKRKEGLVHERKLIANRVEEFKSGLSCIHDFLERKKLKDMEDEGFPVFAFRDGLDWNLVFHLIERECRRLDDGLPMYGFRREILAQIMAEQVTVLIGETGSGKSTQLVQFLADSGISSHGAIVCTQPRKIAAISLAHRVGDEADKCYGHNKIGWQSSYSSDQLCERKVIFMTDHCLLQHCMNDRNLSGVSCIIVDEAHERSLNTDLLLALVRNLLVERHDLRLVIMSATADADQLSEYFFGCATFRVQGRNHPVDVKYVPSVPVGASCYLAAPPGNIAPFAIDVLRMATEVHKSEGEGTILAFLTSQAEVEWACESFKTPNAVPIALHGKLSPEDQVLVFLNYKGKRKVIFATNVAETSLTIPGVKYVIDSGMVKESRFETTSGMNILRVTWVSKSSANQRAGRAGRTEPGRCYRLYSQCDYDAMPAQQEPEIRRVHLGLAVLKILALGVKKVLDFDFIDAPSPEAIDMAIRNLIQLGAVTSENDMCELTDEGRILVKMAIEPRLGKLIIGCCREGLGREGLILAAVMANANSIFCRVGSDVDKKKSDCMKVPFCHASGDLFTLLSVYRQWEGVSREKRNIWCWENSINAKSMRRCQDAVLELEKCLRSELNIIVPGYWDWNPDVLTVHDTKLKRLIVASLIENVAMYSGYDRLGYEVALTGQHVQLHPSCSLLMFNHKPTWVVFGDLLSSHNQYLFCVTAFDVESLSTLSVSPPFDVSRMEKRRLQSMKISGFGNIVLKKFCGKNNSGVLGLVRRLREMFDDERIGILVDVDNDEIQLFASTQYIDMVLSHVKKALDSETRFLKNECLEKCLYLGGPGMSPPVALLGAGAEIKHVELDKRSLTVDVFHPNIIAVDEKELMLFIENNASGVCAVHKFAGYGSEREENERWGSVTFVSPEAAERAHSLDNVDFNGSKLKVKLSGATFGTDRSFLFPAVTAKVFWPRRCSRGIGFVRCFDTRVVDFVINELDRLMIWGKYIRCCRSTKFADSVRISGIDTEASEHEILEVLENATSERLIDFRLLRGDAVDRPPCTACEEALFRELSAFMPKGSPHIKCCRVQVFPPEPKDSFMKAQISFDGRLHLEAARALEQIEGTVLPGCQPWQRIKCQRIFHSSLSCSSSIYSVIKSQLDSLVKELQREGKDCRTEKNDNGPLRVKISAHATQIVAEVRRRLELLMKGTTISHASLNPTTLHHLFSRDGITLMKSIGRETGTHILFDRYNMNVRVFGPPEKIALAEQILVERLVSCYANREMEIRLRGPALRNDLMKEVVRQFGPDLQGLKKRVPEADYSLDTRRHILAIHGGRECKQKVEEIINEIAEKSGHSAATTASNNETTCPICLCEVEDEYKLQSCMHSFCRACLLEQCDSAIRNHDSFPIRCAHQGCGDPIWVADLKALLTSEKVEELFRASLGAFVASTTGAYKYCPSPDCPSIYRVAAPDQHGEPFFCGACYAETCTKCHLEYHEYLSCEEYLRLKEHPDSSLKQWTRGKENVKRCLSCGYIIEKSEGCNHVECKCGKHICWVCLESFLSSEECYNHLTSVHKAIL